MSVDSSPARSHVHAIVGLAERVVAESSDPLARELGVAISQQSRSLLGELAWSEVSHGGVEQAVAPAAVAPGASESEAPLPVAAPPVAAAPAAPAEAPPPVESAEPVPLDGVVDASVLATLADEIGSPDIVATLVDTFLGELDERITAIEAGALDRGEEACRAAHTLKGTAATMGATELTTIAAELEHQFRSGEGEPDALVAQLPGAGQRCRAALGNVVSGMAVSA